MGPEMPQQGTSRTGSEGFQAPPFLGKIRNAMNLMRSGGDPSAMLQSIMQNNPQAEAVMDLIQQHGGDARAAFYDLARQKGVDPNQIFDMMM